MTTEHRLLTARVSAITVPSLVEQLCDTSRRLTVAHLNLHGLALAEKDERVATFVRSADIVFIDGMPIIWYLRARGEPVTRSHRVTVLDWLPLFLARAQEGGLRVFHLGGTRAAADIARHVLLERYPGLRLTTHHGYLAARDDVLDVISTASPDVLLVGMGMPQQELWTAENRHHLAVPVVCTVGGALSYYAGEQATPPRWLGPVGLEGVYRLARDPRRLSHRYLVEPWGLVGPVARDWRTHRRTHHPNGGCKKQPRPGP